MTVVGNEVIGGIDTLEAEVGIEVITTDGEMIVVIATGTDQGVMYVNLAWTVVTGNKVAALVNTQTRTADDSPI